jgi:NAD(P)-dependent dehydrogenase (short-subunit alcohol dehydrogenase family)
MKLTNFVGVVTGGARGIGRSIVMELLQAGCRVVIADFDEVSADVWLNDEAHQNGFGDDKVKFIDTDVKKTEAIHKTLVEAKAWYGRLDIVVNCAGIFTKELDKARTAIETKLVASIDSTYKAIELMSKKTGNKGGVVVNISASYGLHVEKGMPAFNVAYEHGVVAFTRSIALTSTDDGVRVHCVCPGAVETKNAKYNWDRRPSTQAYVTRVGTCGMDKVVTAVNKCIESENSGEIIEVFPEKEGAQ